MDNDERCCECDRVWECDGVSSQGELRFDAEEADAEDEMDETDEDKPWSLAEGTPSSNENPLNNA